ncbi:MULTISPECIES: GIY-YIG nuclease family protein [unclassified Micromonospora]|uniref:GIY-YIG nuclease family protein n=1 Tax=unclassified Micromonospora TaxID=2617518 RepID=UPI001B37E14A|nr:MULTISPECIES: GIY-YIG nuclease family protein [unclassified Micromonospora]MBQ1066091.1 GIY-YIG nuclease family protein [Micromonospora sp. D75]WBB86823.1 GIY-YIG nuclease family protein [Micromonospora sp. WMMC264]
MDDAKVDRVAVDGAGSIAHLLPRSRGRCGIYELTFADGERYVGQAVDVVARFGMHRQKWHDIVEIAFRRVPRDRLDEEERDQIRRRESAGVRLRNVVHTAGRLGAADLDRILPPPRQQRWLAGHEPCRIPLALGEGDPDLRRRTRHQFDRLRADARFTAEMGRLVGAYLRLTIPAPEQTERDFWTLTALPGTNAARYPRLFTVSVHALETLFVCHDRRRPQAPHIRLNIDETVARSQFRTRLRLRAMGAARAPYRVRPGVLALEFESVESAHDALTRPQIVKAARRLNLDLMRKGPALNWKTHCPDLVRHVLSS